MSNGVMLQPVPGGFIVHKDGKQLRLSDADGMGLVPVLFSRYTIGTWPKPSKVGAVSQICVYVEPASDGFILHKAGEQLRLLDDDGRGLIPVLSTRYLTGRWPEPDSDPR